MSKRVQNPGHGFRSKLSDTAIDEEDIDAVEYVVDALDEYTWNEEQGPIWLTGSSLTDPDYGDIDIVVERGTREYGEEYYDAEKDHEIINDMLEDSQSSDVTHDEDSLNCLNDSESVKVNRMSQYDIPVHRYRFELEGTQFDISFCHSPPNDRGIELTPFYGQE